MTKFKDMDIESLEIANDYLGNFCKSGESHNLLLKLESDGVDISNPDEVHKALWMAKGCCCEVCHNEI